MSRATRLRFVSLSIFTLAALITFGCSDHGKNPADKLTSGRGTTAENGLDLTADPATIVIDPDDPNTPTDPDNENKRYGETVLTATALDPSGVPQAGLSLTFGTAAGKLASGGAAVVTDAAGVAHDTLRVYEDDPDSIQVSVGDGTRVTTLVITKVVAEAPVADAGDDQTVECTGDGQATVHLDGSGSTDPNDDIETYEWFENFGTAEQVSLGTGVTLDVPLAAGTHTITLQVTDATDETATDEVVIVVADTTPPTGHASISPSRLWPPNHKMINVHTQLNANDGCGAVTVSLVSITSNEGNAADDVSGADYGTADFDFALRSERNGSGSGRVYTVLYNLVDAAGNTTPTTTTVTVPHDQSGKVR